MTTKRTEVPAGNPVPSVRARDGFLLPGGVVGDGRYRLLAQFGVDQRAAAHLWRARDGQLRRDVALTVLVGTPDDANAAGAARRTLERATHAARLTHPGMARVLDVLSLGSGISPSEGLLGLVVADWSAGTDLIDLVAEHPLPAATAARLLRPLAAAVELAHRSGLVLGVDHPQRVRVTPDGELRLAFPGALATAGLQDDVKGLGAVLYLLLTGTWPLENGPEGLPPAPTAVDGSLVPPAVLRLEVPHELSMASIRCLQDTSLDGIRTPTPLIEVLDRMTEADERTVLITPVGEPPVEEDDGTVWTTRPPVHDAAKRRKLAIGVTILAVATVAVLAWVGTLLIDFFGDDAPGQGGPTVTAGPPSPKPGSSNPPAPTPGEPIAPASVRVYNVAGDADNSRRAKNAVDGDVDTVWKTDTYKQQFPAFKPGIGIMASFAEPVRFATVSVSSPSADTVVEIRSAPSPSPELDETKVIGKATLKPGDTDITLANAEPTQYLIVWISQLGEGNVSAFTELAFVRAQ